MYFVNMVIGKMYCCVLIISNISILWFLLINFFRMIFFWWIDIYRLIVCVKLILELRVLLIFGIFLFLLMVLLKFLILF